MLQEWESAVSTKVVAALPFIQMLSPAQKPKSACERLDLLCDKSANIAVELSSGPIQLWATCDLLCGAFQY